MFIGRFQPLHNGHVSIINTLLESKQKVLIVLMDTKVDKDNPFTLAERKEMIVTAFPDSFFNGDIILSDVPPILSVNIGRKCGYDARYIDSRGLENVSASHIRGLIRKGAGWAKYMPWQVASIISQIQKGRDI